ncbi:hypothetical protein PTI98_008939 [Pleurotus ostreatus]|uniref:Uncharacterized protein n=1 Tax=Pleurotus cornucopiae TaxID=5321 RepID=A0ACB7IW90_PLECO|nr:hypothetical protein CCMSSC00406_0009182 [Pleurotus cornucopiae]KAJ8694006.1 hypothetical protein PTI98_008939 [Pleurotus ostreatus]
MAPKRWTTNEEYAFLSSYIGAYRTAQAGGTAVFASFWPPFFEKWFLKFSIDDEDQRRQQAAKENTGASNDIDDGLGNDDDTVDTEVTEPAGVQTEEQGIRGEKIRKKQQQLRTWFRNNSRLDARPKTASFLDTIASNLGKQSQPRTRARRPVELYSKSRYKSDGIKAKVDQRMIAEAPKDKVEVKAEMKRRWAKIYNEEIGEAWRSVDPAVRKETEEKAIRLAQEEREAQTQENEAAPSATDAVVALSPAESQRHIQLLPVLIPSLLQQLRAKTGWAFTVLAGGPLPIANGDIDVCAFHIGETALGNSFGHAYGDFQEGILRPYTEFVRLAFNAETRQASALNPPPNWSLAPDPTSAAKSTSPSDQTAVKSPPPVTQLPVPTFPCSNNLFTLPTDDDGNQSLTAELFGDLPLFDPQIIAAHAATDFMALNDNSGRTAVYDGVTTWEAGPVGSFNLQNPLQMTTATEHEVTPTNVLATATVNLQTAPAATTEENDPPLTTPPAPPSPTATEHGVTPTNVLATATVNLQTAPAATTEEDDPPLTTPPAPPSPTATETTSPAPPSPTATEHGVTPTNVLATATVNLQTTPTATAEEDDPPLNLRTAPPATMERDQGTSPTATTEEENPPSPATLLSPNAPEWTRKAVEYMVGLGLGDHWLSLVKNWVKLETKLAFGEGVDGRKMRLPTQGRPLQLKDWMQRHRPYTSNAVLITDVVAFGSDVQKWWNTMQPAWRRGDGDTLQGYVPPENGNWDELAKGGANGLLLLVLAMGWWGKIDSSNAWKGLVCDALKTFDAMMLATAPLPAPTPSDAPDTLLAPAQRKRRQKAAVEDLPAPKRTRARGRT